MASKRSPVRRSKDKRIFSRTAKHTKAINVSPTSARGGRRL